VEDGGFRIFLHGLNQLLNRSSLIDELVTQEDLLVRETCGYAH
jgi:hypothetical protein